MTVSPARRQEIHEAILAGVSRGTPVTLVLADLGVPLKTWEHWQRYSEEIREAIQLARDLGHDRLARECLEIIDDTSEDVILDNEGVPHFNGAAVLRAKARVETRLKLLAKWNPKRYGESQRVEVSGELQVTQRHVVDSRSLTDDGRAALRRLLAEAQAKGLLPAPQDDPSVMEVVEAEYHEVIEDGEADAADDLGDDGD